MPRMLSWFEDTSLNCHEAGRPQNLNPSRFWVILQGLCGVTYWTKPKGLNSFVNPETAPTSSNSFRSVNDLEQILTFKVVWNKLESKIKHVIPHPAAASFASTSLDGYFSSIFLSQTLWDYPCLFLFSYTPHLVSLKEKCWRHLQNMFVVVV